MLTARSVIIAIVAVAILSVASAVFSLLWGGQSNSTLGRDSYGTRTDGYRAIHDLLDALEFETVRTLIPTATENTHAASYVLWNPLDSLVQTEPAHFKVLSQWVRDGGRLVVAPSVESEDSDDSNCRRCSSAKCSTCVPIALLNELGLSEVSIEEIELGSGAAGNNQRGKRVSASDQDDADPEDIRETVRDVFRIKKRPSAVYSIECDGEWDYLSSQVNRVQLSSEQVWRVNYGEQEPLARITIAISEDASNTLAALFTLGKGQIVVISNPFMASNVNLSGADNSVLLAHLLTGRRSRVIFDEFYHGLTVRGNALWLLSKRPYAVITVSILAVVGLLIWRQAIFLGPSRQERPASRRSLNEYVEAMSRFILQGRESPKYVLHEVRDGVLWHFCKSLGLPPQQQNTDMILGLLSRRQPQKASQLQAALKYADVVLDNPRAPKDEILLATRKVSDCL